MDEVKISEIMLEFADEIDRLIIKKTNDLEPKHIIFVLLSEASKIAFLHAKPNTNVREVLREDLDQAIINVCHIMKKLKEEGE